MLIARLQTTHFPVLQRIVPAPTPKRVECTPIWVAHSSSIVRIRPWHVRKQQFPSALHSRFRHGCVWLNPARTTCSSAMALQHPTSRSLWVSMLPISHTVLLVPIPSPVGCHSMAQDTWSPAPSIVQPPPCVCTTTVMSSALQPVSSGIPVQVSTPSRSVQNGSDQPHHPIGLMAGLMR